MSAVPSKAWFLYDYKALWHLKEAGSISFEHSVIFTVLRLHVVGHFVDAFSNFGYITVAMFCGLFQQ